MSFFKSPKRGSPEEPEPTPGSIPITAINLSKRYDIYCHTPGDYRLYEDFRFLGIRTFERMRPYSSGLIGGYLEIEARNGTRVMLSHHYVRMFCEHGSQPAYKVLAERKPNRGD
jgi:hypothetical protein